MTLQIFVLFSLALCQLTLASAECNPFLVDEGRSSPDIDVDVVFPDMDELVFLAEFSRFMNERAPALLQVCSLVLESN